MAQSSTLNDGLSIEDIHDILRNNRRRLAIQCLQRSPSGTMELGDLAEEVARLETGEDPPPRDKRKSAYISLHQSHLSKLDDWGIVDYDTATKEIHLQERVEAIAPFMALDDHSANRWCEGIFLIGLVGLGIVAVTGSLVPAGAFQVIAALLFIAIMTAAGIQAYLQEDRVLFRA